MNNDEKIKNIIARLRKIQHKWEEESKGQGRWCCANAARNTFSDCANEIEAAIEEIEKETI